MKDVLELPRCNELRIDLPFHRRLIWREVGRRFGHSSEHLQDFFVGPGFLPFGWMGCIDRWAGPLPDRESLRAWLAALADAGDAALLRTARTVDTELLVLMLRDRVHVFLDPKDEEWQPPEGARTLDGQFHLLPTQPSDDIADLIMAENYRVAKKKGIELDLEELAVFIEAATTAAAEHITSMLKDVLSQRKTEIGSFNEAVAIEAERLGLAAPVNKTVGLLMRIIEKTYERQVF